VIHVDKVHRTWSFSLESRYFRELHEVTEPARVMRGGDDGSLWTTPQGTIPDNPSLPELGTLLAYLKSLYVGSSEDAVRTQSSSPQARFLPSVDGAGSTSGTWVTRSDRPLDVSVEGVRRGTYTQSYAGQGFVASLSGVPTAKGVHDAVTGAGESIELRSGANRPLHIDLAQRRSGSETIAATIDSRASANGADSAGFSGSGALTYAHDGAPTVLRFALTSVRRNGSATAPTPACA
jgi:hypothetical protein